MTAAARSILPITPDSIDRALRHQALQPVDESGYFWSDTWDPDFYVALARAGFISIAIEHERYGDLLIAELQEAYAVLDWPALHVPRKIERLLRATRLEEEGIELRLSHSCGEVLEALLAYHGEGTWLVPSMIHLLRVLSESPRDGFSLVAVELRVGADGALVAGELGYTIGRTYTSLSGFCTPAERRFRGFGTLQLVLLAHRLEQSGYAFWNLGHPHMPYKTALGARPTPRSVFLERWRTTIIETPERPLLDDRGART